MENDKKEGIYFGMPEEEYHALPYLSRSMVENMFVDVEEAWYKSCFNPDRPDQTPTEAMRLGTAIHSAILEPDIFDELYCVAPSIEDYEDKKILKTSDDLKNFLEKLGEKKTGKKEDLIERALPYVNRDKVIIWDIVREEFEAENEGKRKLSAESWKTIKEIRQSIERRPRVKKIFSKGYPEVTIIWKDAETGVMCKCRLDYVRPEAISELKSFSLKHKKSMYKACFDEILYQKYNLQFAIYSIALETIIKRINEGKAEVFGEVDQEWLKEFLQSPKKQFYFLFVRTQAPFQVMSVQLSRKDGNASTLQFTEPLLWFRSSTKKFKAMREKYGDERWIDEDYVREIDEKKHAGFLYQFKN